MTIDLNSTATRRSVFSRSIEQRIDAVVSVDTRKAAIDRLLADLEANPPETEERPGRSVSASAVGDECARRVQLGIWPTFHPDKPAPRKLPLEAKTKIIFARGHATETMMAEWLLAAGFDLLTRTPEDFQFGFAVAGGQIKGFADGIIRNFFASPQHPPSVRYMDTMTDANWMVMWEHKTIAAKGFRAVIKHGILKQYPKYDAQAQILMAYLDLPATLFSFLNAETGELFFDLTPFDQQRAQAASDRAVWILQATRAGDLLPRIAAPKEGERVPKFPCQWCDFREECWPQ